MDSGRATSIQRFMFTVSTPTILHVGTEFYSTIKYFEQIPKTKLRVNICRIKPILSGIPDKTCIRNVADKSHRDCHDQPPNPVYLWPEMIW